MRLAILRNKLELQRDLPRGVFIIIIIIIIIITVHTYASAGYLLRCSSLQATQNPHNSVSSLAYDNIRPWFLILFFSASDRASSRSTCCIPAAALTNDISHDVSALSTLGRPARSCLRKYSPKHPATPSHPERPFCHSPPRVNRHVKSITYSMAMDFSCSRAEYHSVTCYLFTVALLFIQFRRAGTGTGVNFALRAPLGLAGARKRQ